MDTDDADARRVRKKELLLAALEHDATDRAAFLEKVCAGDLELLTELKRLVRASEQARSALDAPLQRSLNAGRTQDLLGRLRDARYRDEGRIARGGMGEIRRVVDEHLRRTLAMKVLLGHSHAGGGDDSRTPPVRADDRSLSRFLEEAQVTGQLEHPGIVPVHELGLDGQHQPFFTMKLVKGHRPQHDLRSRAGRARRLERRAGPQRAASGLRSHELRPRQASDPP